MNFERISLYCLESKEGYRVSVQMVSSVWVYTAHGPKRKPIKNGKMTVGVSDPVKGELMFKEQYKKGESVPAYREHIGTFRSDVYGSTDSAKAAAIDACEKKYFSAENMSIDAASDSSRVLLGSQPDGYAAPREISSRDDALRGL